MPKAATAPRFEGFMLDKRVWDSSHSEKPESFTFRPRPPQVAAVFFKAATWQFAPAVPDPILEILSLKISEIERGSQNRKILEIQYLCISCGNLAAFSGF